MKALDYAAMLKFAMTTHYLCNNILVFYSPGILFVILLLDQCIFPMAWIQIYLFVSHFLKLVFCEAKCPESFPYLVK